MRASFGLPSDYARIAVNAAVSRARSYYGLRQSKRQKRTAFPQVAGSQSLGLGVNAYAVVENDGRWVLRRATEPRGDYVWLPLCVPAKWRDRMQSVYGDAQLFERNGDGYVRLPWRIDDDAPPVCDGEPTATVSTPVPVEYFAGTAVRHRREHVADLRRRYQKHKRLDRVKAMGDPERG